MAEIVLGFATSHGPLLATPPHEWDLRGAVDRRNSELAWRDKTYDFASLLEARGPEFVALNAADVRADRFARCQRSLDELGRVCEDANPDALLIIGDDHHEWFMPDIQPAFSIFHGDQLLNRALSEAETERQNSFGLSYAAQIYYPERDETYACPSALASHLVSSAIGSGFDVTSCAAQPSDAGVPRRLGHSFGFIYRRILSKRPPLIPVMVNTYYPPNQPSARRCFEFGRALGRALQAWPGGERVAVAASGGMTHFVVDEEMDARLLDAMRTRDYERLVSEPEIYFRSGTSEIKNWIVVAGILAETNLAMKIIDYAACYRTEAGTGSGMGFALWR